MKRCSPKVFAMGALLTVVSYAAGAHAEEVVVTRERSPVTGPNRSMLHSGVVTLGVSYVPALVVAMSSSESYDKKLYVPVAGPWMDFASRDCKYNCSHETMNKALLVTDGIFQGIGALQIIGSFLFPETHTTVASGHERRVAKRRTFQIAPSRMGTAAYGLTAFGRF